jgi:hypothetical protein
MTTPYRYGQSLGLLTPGSVSIGSTALNAAATWFALSFVPDSARTLSAFRAYVASVTGTLGPNDVTASLYDSSGSSGAPGAAIETGKVPTATITAAGWYDFTGFTTVLTAGLQYWIVFKNGNAAPASNLPIMRFVNTPLIQPVIGNGNGRGQWGRATTTNSGTTWSQTLGSFVGRIAYADGTFDGQPAQNAVASDLVYGSREAGVKFTTPANAALRVRGLAMQEFSKTGTPTGAPRLGLWTGSTPSNQGYTVDLPTTLIGGQLQWLVGYFASPVTVQPGTICRATFGEDTNADSSSNAYAVAQLSLDSDSNSLALLPFEGTLQYTLFDGTSTWTDTAAAAVPFALLLDSAGEFGVLAGSGGRRPKLVGLGV